jgi:hypothetical protein
MYPGLEAFASRASNLKLHRSMGLLLHDRRTHANLSSYADILNAETDQIASAQFAVDGEVEHRQVSRVCGELKARTDGPDLG